MYVQNNKRFARLSGLLLAALMTLVVVLPVHAMTAQQYFEDGNRLFRDDLYWAALLRYRQAAEQGLDTPLLHYNTGVTHYRADQHRRARESLLKALSSATLRDVTHYNLGLNAYALGDTEEALRWLRLARDQQNNEKLSQYAVVAIARIRDGLQADPLLQRAEKRRKEQQQKLGDLDLHLRVGFGNDDNVFRSPDRSYFDLSDPAQPIVTPTVQSGAYVPVDLRAKYRLNTFKYEGFYALYRISGRYYQDEALDNANTYTQEAAIGNEYKHEEDGRRRIVRSSFRIAQHDEVYYDPDNGLVRTVNGESIEDRLNYVRYGPEIAVKQGYGNFAVGFSAKGQLWNYGETVTVPEWDHEYFNVGLNAEYKFSSTSLARLSLKKKSRRFGDRPSYDLDGVQRAANPTVRYDYLSAEFTARQRVTRNMWFGVNFEYSQREDRHVGYNDYSRNSYGAEFHWAPWERWKFDAGARFRIYDFDNAFAYNDPLASRKILKTERGYLRAAFRMKKNLSLRFEGSYQNNVSNDIRIQYERSQFTLGVVWEPDFL